MDENRMVSDIIERSKFFNETKTYLKIRLDQATSYELLMADIKPDEARELKERWNSLEFDQRYKLPYADVHTKEFDQITAIINMLFEQTLQKAVVYRPLFIKASL